VPPAGQTEISASPENQLIDLVEGSAKFYGVSLGPLEPGVSDAAFFIEELQRRLDDFGYAENERTSFGEYDEQTVQAVKGLQREFELKPTGLLDDAAWDKFARYYETEETPPLSSPLQVGATGIEVRTVQWRLRQLGIYHFPVNGRFDDNTMAAVQMLKAVLGLPLDSGIDQGVWQTVNNPYELTKLVLHRLQGKGIVVPVAGWGEGVKMARASL
jgi:hypothetical protein